MLKGVVFGPFNTHCGNIIFLHIYIVDNDMTTTDEQKK